MEFGATEYRQVGENLARAMYEYYYVAKQIERETALMNGWLKPKLLNELSGVPAAVLLCEELERKKREDRRRKGTDDVEPHVTSEEAASKRVNELIKRSNSICRPLSNTPIFKFTG